MKEQDKQMVVDSAKTIDDTVECAILLKLDTAGSVVYCPAGDMTKRKYFFSRIIGILAREIEREEEKSI